MNHMRIEELIQKFSHSREKQIKAIFSTLFIAGNRLQTVFDVDASDVTLKQFMLLTMVRNSKEQLTLTQLGELMGCSRQNVKKLAAVLEKKGLVILEQSEKDLRAACIRPTEKMEQYFKSVALSHKQKLGCLFEAYSDQEVEQLFRLLMKLYGGIDTLETGLPEFTKGTPIHAINHKSGPDTVAGRKNG